MKKETMERKLSKMILWIEDLVELRDTRRIPREEIRAIMEDQMGLICQRTQDRWIRILVRRKFLIPLDVEGKILYVPGERTGEQDVLEVFDVPDVKLEVKRNDQAGR